VLKQLLSGQHDDLVRAAEQLKQFSGILIDLRRTHLCKAQEFIELTEQTERSWWGNACLMLKDVKDL